MKSTRICLLAVLAWIQLQGFAQSDSLSLPVSSETGKVTYAGKFDIPGYSAGEILDKVHIWLSYFHEFRGSFGPVYQIPEHGFLHASVQMNITSSARIRFWWVNASFKAHAGDGFLEYEISDFYTFTSTLLVPHMDAPYEGPLEENEYFNIYDLDSLNDNARNLDAEVHRLIRSLKEFMARTAI
ncbi:MAG TPA: hypothetical protein ENN63_11880 [Bacteroidetes bacterium]|nr:hypothetical protein [Bacteroidota bacterium]